MCDQEDEDKSVKLRPRGRTLPHIATELHISHTAPNIIALFLRHFAPFSPFIFWRIVVHQELAIKNCAMVANTY